MKFYENIEAERDRIEACITKYGHTSDHHLDWWSCSAITLDGMPVFVEFINGSGLLAHRYPNEWRIWSDPLSRNADMADRIVEFALEIIQNNKINEIWCDDVSDNIYPGLKKDSTLKLNEIYYSLQWPILDMKKYYLSLPGGHFKEMRNARNKFYREHGVKILEARSLDQNDLYRIVDAWKKELIKKQNENDIAYLKYRLAIKNNFRGFVTSRVMVVDGKPVGFNAGYEVVNNPGRFAGIIGLHDYSLKDLGTILWLEDLDWIKNSGYKELDMQGSEDDGGLKLKLQFGAKIERKTDTFSIKNSTVFR